MGSKDANHEYEKHLRETIEKNSASKFNAEKYIVDETYKGMNDHIQWAEATIRLRDSDIKKLKSRLSLCMETLEFYGEEYNYCNTNSRAEMVSPKDNSPVVLDSGFKARDTISKLKDGE